MKITIKELKQIINGIPNEDAVIELPVEAFKRPKDLYESDFKISVGDKAIILSEEDVRKIKQEAEKCFSIYQKLDKQGVPLGMYKSSLNSYFLQKYPVEVVNAIFSSVLNDCTWK